MIYLDQFPTDATLAIDNIGGRMKPAFSLWVEKSSPKTEASCNPPLPTALRLFCFVAAMPQVRSLLPQNSRGSSVARSTGPRGEKR
jgi:hypothetical protein